MPAPAAPAAAVAVAQRVAGTPAGTAGAAPRQDGGQGWQGMLWNAARTWLIVTVLTQGVKWYMGQNSPAQATPQPVASIPGQTATVNGSEPTPPLAIPLWPIGTIFDAHLFVTSAPTLNLNTFDNPEVPHVKFADLKLGDWKWKKEWTTEVVLPSHVQRNGTLWLQTVLTRNGSPINPNENGFAPENVYYSRKALMNYQRLKRTRAERNLISGSSAEPAVSEEEEEEKDKAMPIVSYYHPNVSISIVSNAAGLPTTGLQPQLAAHIQIVPPAEGTVNPRYYPIVFPNAFWQLKSAMYPINDTVAAVPLHVTFSPIGTTKWQLYATMDESFKQASEKQGMSADMDEFKRVLLETNPVLLATTIIVTVLHMLFEMLAFKNDVSHWRNQKSQVGVSLRTIVTNVVVQLIVTLYLFDNSTDTSWMILFSQGTGLLIEAWKITKAVDIKLVRTNTGVLPYKIQITDKHVLSKEEQETKEYDALAFKYVGIGFAPFMIGYTIYSLLYESHRGWYSFVITTLTQAVHLFGFALMIPQLIINYKLKSVAHMPLRSLTYKALNTVVDDFFSFVIKMPTLHRLACFRDDVVFVILLYQMYIYPKDMKRANEYGQVGDDEGKTLEQIKASSEKENDTAIGKSTAIEANAATGGKANIVAASLDSKRAEPEKEETKAAAAKVVKGKDNKKNQ